MCVKAVCSFSQLIHATPGGIIPRRALQAVSASQPKLIEEICDRMEGREGEGSQSVRNSWE